MRARARGDSLMRGAYVVPLVLAARSWMVRNPRDGRARAKLYSLSVRPETEAP